MFRMLMAAGRGCCALAILLAIVDIQPGGCIHITNSASQEGKRLNLICTVWYNNEEVEGLIVFLCKNRSRDCSPETSLEQLRLKQNPGTDGAGDKSSQLVFTINQVTPSDSGTYQCCARSQKSDIHLQGHFFSILVAGESLILLCHQVGQQAGLTAGSDTFLGGTSPSYYSILFHHSRWWMLPSFKAHVQT
ncbi:CD160 antigen isoform X1 [Carlito syrichta]|uniref:CD160 antigen isoform X1 n=1 Tax=Carlito syrichta TaxID=1868482 RepID=A0A3Q0ED63_CARSF|nr:CD160 antigen isoform X1 [Carlito syrichta]